MQNMSQNQPGTSLRPEQTPYVQPQNQRDFLAQVNVIRDLLASSDSALQEVANLHNRLLSADSTSTDTSTGSRLQNIETESLSRNDQIRRFIQRLAQDAANTPQGTPEERQLKEMKVKQVGPLRREFQNKLSAYQNLEKEYREARREQIRRQFLIVNPEASDEELRHVADPSVDVEEGVFRMALSNRRGQAQSALGAVRQRHAELQRIEQTITQLAAMFNDVEQLVVAQEPLVEETEHNAINTQTDVENGNVQVDKAIGLARSRNKMKWWCLGLVILIILGIALGVGLGVGLNRAVSGGGNNNNNNSSNNNQGRNLPTDNGLTEGGRGG